jgi:hypothetical protein
VIYHHYVKKILIYKKIVLGTNDFIPGRFSIPIRYSSVSGLPISEKIINLEREYMKAKDEVLTLYREKGDVSIRDIFPNNLFEFFLIR